MVDSLTKEQRHRVMSSIRSKDTRPEMLVRRLLFAEGYRYRLHASDLPGTPDLVFRGNQQAIFVNGCFWHSHGCSNGSHKPATNAEFWDAKRTRTVQRDGQALAGLESLGWRTLTVWECELHDLGSVAASLHDFLGPPGHSRKPA
ncbi:T/G mismatch-specific endonuclease [Arthrobacter alpinus]|uniref:Very short patch repair endonuclease n=1 Tax=Arthrobacter alpinus TaxID=656366 RepID=A0A1H5MPM3_9MICC|nr:very short patch repair endonuclease [Arthrobacter alpinus]SEE91315.1 T/G mismatch-specific endonuclease [Arthrobacter alpinus]